MKPFLIMAGVVAVTAALIVAGTGWLLAFLLSAIINGVVMALAEELTEDH